MAKQEGIVPLKGTIGNITFYKSQDGYQARQRGGIAKGRIATDPAFARTRENMAEFTRAAKSGKLLRTALRPLLMSTKDNRMISRLTKEMGKVLRADATSDRGLRNVIDGETELLKGFDFNVNSLFGNTLFAPYSVTIDRVTGKLSAEIMPFVPADLITAPSGCTHFRINSAGAEIDFETERWKVDTKTTDILAWDSTPVAGTSLVNEVSENSTHPLFLILGIEFFQEVNGKKYPLKNGAFNALSIAEVSGTP